MTKSKCPTKKGPIVLFQLNRTVRSETVSSGDDVDGNEDQVEAAPTFNIAQSQSYKAAVEKSRLDESYFPYTKCDVFLTVFGICGYIFDLGSDIFVACAHFRNRNFWWFGLTVSFIAVPALVVSAFSLTWYLQDRKQSVEKESARRWVFRYVLLFLQLGPIVRNVDALVYGIRGMRASARDEGEEARQLLKQKQWEETDSALLRLLKGTMEAAPQLTLQLYIIAVQGIQGHLLLVIGQSISCVTSLCSVSWCLTAYQNSLRLSLPDKANITRVAMVPMFFWRVFTIGARVVCFSLFASTFSHWIVVVVVSHWTVMFVWILLQNTNFCENSVEEFFFNVVAATVNIFCFFNLLEGHTRLRYTIFYALVYLENLAMIVTWYSFHSTDDAWYVVPAMVAVLALFFVGISFQVVYYLCFHPNNRFSSRQIRIYVPCGDLLQEAADGMYASKFGSKSPVSPSA